MESGAGALERGQVVQMIVVRGVSEEGATVWHEVRMWAPRGVPNPRALEYGAGFRRNRLRPSPPTSTHHVNFTLPCPPLLISSSDTNDKHEGEEIANNYKKIPQYYFYLSNFYVIIQLNIMFLHH